MTYLVRTNQLHNEIGIPGSSLYQSRRRSIFPVPTFPTLNFRIFGKIGRTDQTGSKVLGLKDVGKLLWIELISNIKKNVLIRMV